MTNVEPLRDSSFRIAVMELPDTLLGFETTSPSPLRPECGKPGVVRSPGKGGWRVVAPSLGVGCGV
jgi:hypothetical protein